MDFGMIKNVYAMGLRLLQERKVQQGIARDSEEDSKDGSKG